MGGLGYALADKAEFGVIVDQAVFAGQNEPFAALGPGLGDDVFQQAGGAALAAVGGQGVHPEDHLPGAGFTVKGGVVVHLVGQVGGVGAHPVDKADDLLSVLQQPEVVGINGQ